MKIQKLAKNTIIFLGAATLAFSTAISSTALGAFMGAIQAQAAQQSYTWVQEGEIWRLKDASGNNIANTWYQDATGARYYLDASGVMKTGLVDVSGYSYYLDASGKMMVTDGVYEGVNLIFDKDVNSATYGAILSGAQELKAAKQAQTQTQVSQPQTQEQKEHIQPNTNSDQSGLSRIAPLDDSRFEGGSYEPIDETNIFWG